ncbi:hypothetical protein, partial [Megasphaera sp.]|uniref:hypothetical protein n=1 Tax=Megasphaera sp. TaxID=2023260 RepID=UPI00402A4818
LSIPKRIFVIINTFGYLVFVGLIYVNITGKMKFSPSLFVLINFLPVCLLLDRIFCGYPARPIICGRV